MNMSIYRSIATQYQNLRVINTVPMMNTISHLIEQEVIDKKLPIDFYAGFQRFSRFPDQMRFYQKLGAVARRVYVFGVADVKPPSIPGVEFIELEAGSALAQEWFLLVDSPEFWTLLSTQETDGRDEVTGGRRYDGLWTFDTQVIDRAALIISQVMDRNYEPVTRRDHTIQNQHVTHMTERLIERMEMTRVKSNRRWAHVNTMQQIITSALRKTDVHEMLQQTANILNLTFQSTDVVILMRNSETQYRVAASAGETRLKQDMLIDPEGIVSKAVSQKSMVLVSDTRKTRERDFLIPTAQSIMAVPAVSGERVEGVIIVGGSETSHWGEEDGRVLMSIATLIAQAVEARNNAPAPMSAENTSIQELRAPIVYLMSVHQKMRQEGELNARQRQYLDYLTRLSFDIAKLLQIPPSQMAKLLAQDNQKP